MMRTTGIHMRGGRYKRISDRNTDRDRGVSKSYSASTCVTGSDTLATRLHR